MMSEQKLESADDYSELDFEETTNAYKSINLTEFFKDEYGVATKNRTISGNVTMSNPFGFVSDHLSQHASCSSHPANLIVE
jgi:hypothetical protein